MGKSGLDQLKYNTFIASKHVTFARFFFSFFGYGKEMYQGNVLSYQIAIRQCLAPQQ